MRNSRGGPGDTRSRDKAGALRAHPRSRRVKAREAVAGRKSQSIRQRVIAAGPSLASGDLTLRMPEDDTEIAGGHPGSPKSPASSFRTIPVRRCWRDDLRALSAMADLRPRFRCMSVAHRAPE